MTVHLVNLSNPMMMKGPLREFLPVGEQSVIVRLPEGRRAQRVRFLVRGGEPVVKRTAGEIQLTVPGILDHEAIAIDFA